MVLKINLIAANPKGSKLIFFTPFRGGVNERNQLQKKVNKRKVIFFFMLLLIQRSKMKGESLKNVIIPILGTSCKNKKANFETCLNSYQILSYLCKLTIILSELECKFLKMNAVLGFLGTQEIIIIAIVLVLMFGAKKIPQLMRGVGSGIKEFKDGMKEGEDDAKKDKEIDSSK